jgi:hypothetical protein
MKLIDEEGRRKAGLLCLLLDAPRAMWWNAA